jgi:hypothetical protein
MPNCINSRSADPALQDGPIVQMIFARREGAASGMLRGRFSDAISLINDFAVRIL